MVLATMTILWLSRYDLDAFAKRIEDAYFEPTTGYYREERGKDDVAFNWTLGIIISAQNAMAKLDNSYIPKLKSTLEKADTYWNSHRPTAGFDILPGTPPPDDRYYDDNAWMVMSLVESYEITKENRWLKRAEQALTFGLSGEDSTLGGGIYWREKEKNSKNTCSNGPAAAACLAVYKENHDEKLLKKAEELYRWTKSKLQDPKDGLYFDSMNLSGKIEKTKWSYNSALMLRSAKALFQETKREEFKADADRLEKACIAHWIKPDGSISDELQFAHLLFENLSLKAFDAQKCIEKLKDLVQADGFYPKKWISSTAPSAPKLMIQVSALRAFATFEHWKKDRRTGPNNR